MFAAFLKTETHRTIFRWQTLFAVLLFALLFFYSYQESYIDPSIANPPTNEYNAFYAYLDAHGKSPVSFTSFVVPLIIVLIIGDSLAIDLQTGQIKNILIRTNIHNYLKGKLLGASLISFVFIFLCELISWISALAIFPTTPPIPLSEGLSPSYGQEIISQSPTLYILLIMFNTGLMSMALTLLCFLLSLFQKNLVAILAIPWIIFQLSGFLFYNLGLKEFSLPALGIMYIVPYMDYPTYVIPLFWITTWMILYLIIWKIVLKRVKAGEFIGK